jgi:hypothetical protein
MLKKLKISLSNGGLIINSDVENFFLKFNNIKSNYGFISSAVASMVGDKPENEEITRDVYKIKIVDSENNSSVTLPYFIISKSFKNNFPNINEYLKLLNKKANGFNISIEDFKIANLKKCGILIKNDEIVDYRFMGINDTHIQQYHRDFLGFYLDFNFKGSIKLLLNNLLIDEEIKFQFSRIPLLSFKSENAFKNKMNRKFTIMMLQHFSGKSVDPIFA